jgi:hypothetical protein
MDGFSARAVDLYRRALALWDHPAIHFNLAKALMNIDQPALAYRHLQDSMKFGGPPLDEDQLDQVKRYSELLYDNDLAELEITIDEPGARVTMDGNELVVGPGTWRGVVQPDRVGTILATKTGYQTEQVRPELVKGQLNRITIEMELIELIMRYERVFDAWIPWVVLGTGLAIVGGGAVLHWQSGESFNDFDSAVLACTGVTPSQFFLNGSGETVTHEVGGSAIGQCSPGSAMTSKNDQGSLFQTLGFVAYGVGGAAIVTGIVLAVINRERPIFEESPESDAPSVSITPIIGPESAGISATIGF